MLNIELKTLRAIAELKGYSAFTEFMRWIADTANEMGLNSISMVPDPHDTNFDTRHHFMRGCASVLITLNDILQSAENMIEERKQSAEIDEIVLSAPQQTGGEI